MDFQAFKQAVIEEAKALGIAAYELYYQAEESTSISAFKHETNKFTSSAEGGVCFRCLHNGHMGYASTQELSAEQAAALVRRAMDNADVLESDEPEFLGEGGKTYQELDVVPYALPDTQQLTDCVLKAQDAVYAADNQVTDGGTSQAFSETYRIAIVNSNGLDLSYENSLAGVMLSAVVTDGTEKADSYKFKVGSFDKLDLGELANKAVTSAKSKLGAEVAPTGAYPVVFSPDAMADLLATYVSVFSSESAQKGLSRLGDKEGQVIASPAVTLVDDPFHKDSPMPIAFDAEGSPTSRKNIIENGVLKTLLYNLKTASVAGKETTGNAFKGSYASKVSIAPFTFYLAAGEISEEELLRQAGNGVYINSLGGLHAGANVISGDFSLQSAGFMIENGVKTTAVKSFTVAGNFYDLLGQIRTVASNLELSDAAGMMNFGSPSVLVDGLSIAGK